MKRIMKTVAKTLGTSEGSSILDNTSKDITISNEIDPDVDQTKKKRKRRKKDSSSAAVVENEDIDDDLDEVTQSTGDNGLANDRTVYIEGGLYNTY